MSRRVLAAARSVTLCTVTSLAHVSREITFEDGQQFVSVVAGSAVSVFGLRD